MLGLERRAEAEELLDQPDVGIEELKRSLTDLEMANRWLGGRRAVLSHVLPLLDKASSLLDIGCGSGDTLRAVSEEAGRRGRLLRLVGVDVNPAILDIAETRCASYQDITLAQASATSLPFPDGDFDIVTSSLVVHHLGHEDAVSALREAARVATRTVVVTDLVRSVVAFGAVWAVGKLAFGKLSRYDGPVSVRRSYTPAEFRKLAESAGLADAEVTVGLVRMVLLADSGG